MVDLMISACQFKRPLACLVQDNAAVRLLFGQVRLQLTLSKSFTEVNNSEIRSQASFFECS